MARIEFSELGQQRIDFYRGISGWRARVEKLLGGP
jgi:hypothetical protein